LRHRRCGKASGTVTLSTYSYRPRRGLYLENRVIDQLGLPPEQAESLRQHKATNVSLQLGGLGPVTVTAASATLIYDGALNAAILEQMVLIIDLNRSLAWATLKRRRPDA